MAFTWKARKDIFKGEGIYHVTWVVAGRLPLLGKLEQIEAADVTRPLGINRRDVTAEEWERMQTSRLAHVAHTPLGFAVSADLNHISERHEGVRLLGKVVMLQSGFPADGTDAARFYHPGGAYHKVCGEGKLYLMAPLPENYKNPQLIDITEKELVRKAAEKGKQYYGIPHESTRWRMIAGNMMLNMIAKIK